MTSYATLTQLRGPSGRLDQYTLANGSADTTRDTFLQACLDQATSIINLELGYTLTAATVGTQVVYGTGTVWLPLPQFTAGSVTLVETLSNYTVPEYVESGSALRITDTAGVYTVPPYPQLAWSSLYGYGSIWLPGVPYTVHATYGVSADDLVVAAACCLEMAVQLWKFKDSGGSAVIGTDVGAVTVKNDYSPIVRRMLGHLKPGNSLTNASVF